MNEPVIAIEGLGKSYGGRVVVDQVSFRVDPGECFGILGPNGAGKSTTLRMIIGLTPADRGSLRLFGRGDPASLRACHARMGIVPQEETLDEDLTVHENLLVHGRYFALREEWLAARIETLLPFAQLTGQREQAVRTLSGGMKRRLTLARSLVANPDLVVLDEPTTGLDPQARHLIWQRLRQLREEGVTLLLTTHYMEEAARLCDRLLVMNHGRILDLDTPEALIRRHVEPEVVEIRSRRGPLPREIAATLPGRHELVGDTLYSYTNDASALLEEIRQQPGLLFLHRPANLEDVFLKLTGRELEE
ncbi:MAG: ATP-binding cassette domain-containing protein [Magnetococcales bacterium]|nr:ATP-binding cassette domain-containing protein [Magnetococcales bacterium]MBF0157355.1 ATP-binding cassette domain-containing protein [Magnetococcales bacterium]